jgi:hypothetical protein
MTQNISHNNIYGEDIFKDNVKIENRTLIVKPTVLFSLVVELVNFIKSICEIILLGWRRLNLSKLWGKIIIETHTTKD